MALQPAGRGPQVMGVYLLFSVLTTIAAALRVYCRACVIRSLGLDDWLAVVAWSFFGCYAAFAVHGVYHGTGQHAWNIQPQSEIVIGLKSWWLCEPFYVLSNMAIKGSIALMLLRIVVDSWHRTIIYITLIVTETFSAAFFLVFVFQCIPSNYFWMRYAGAEGSCLNTSVVVSMVYAYSSVICVGDWIFSILPFWLVWRLEHMHTREKIMIGFILSMSAIASIATVIRIPYIYTLSDTADFLYATSDVAIWSCCETGLAITASCCATLRPLFSRCLGLARLSSPRSSIGTDTELQPQSSKVESRVRVESDSLENISFSSRGGSGRAKSTHHR